MYYPSGASSPDMFTGLSTPPPPPSQFIPPPPQASGGEARKLPPGWTTVTDENGQIYYWDVITGQTRWTSPESDRIPPPPANENNDYEVVKLLPPGWMHATDADGSIYYWEVDTGYTTWTHPGAQNAPPPPPIQGMQGEKLPPGWTSVIHDDGNIYYWQVDTGKTRWTHPGMDQPPPPNHSWWDSADVPFYPSSRPDDHMCLALLAFCFFPPLGLFAVIHSCLVGRNWNRGFYVDSHFHAQLAKTFGILGAIGGIAFWGYVLFWRQGGMDNWSNWNWEWPLHRPSYSSTGHNRRPLLRM